MTTAPIPADLRALAPDLAARVGAILMGLAALIARAFLKHPTRSPLILPLWNRLKRASIRFERALARAAANRPPRKPRPGRPSGSPPTRFPNTCGWLLRDLRHEGAFYRSSLERLLNEPGVADLVARAPGAARILRPIARMLFLDHPALARPKPPAARATPAPPPPSPSPEPAPEQPVFVLPDPPCPRLRHRWPWRAPPVAKRE